MRRRSLVAGTKRVDLGLMRIFKLGERIEMPFKAEATNAFKKDNKTAKLPADDRIPVQISDITGETVVPTYPVMEYGHVPGGGDAIGAGLLYNGKAIPIRRGKYVFSDITTGRIWYADYKEMLAATTANPKRSRRFMK